MDERERVTDQLQELREMGHSYRAIADILNIPSDFANLRRIYTGGNVGQAIIRRVALAMGIIKPRPALDAYRPVIKPETLGMIASGQEIAEILDAMRIAGISASQVVEMIEDTDWQLRRLGHDPDEVGAKMQAIADKAIQEQKYIYKEKNDDIQ